MSASPSLWLLFLAIVTPVPSAGAVDSTPTGLMDDPFPPRAASQDVALRLWPAQRVDHLGEEMYAILEMTNISEGSVWQDWQPKGYGRWDQDWKPYNVSDLRMEVDAGDAARNGITVRRPLYGGPSPIVILRP